MSKYLVTGGAGFIGSNLSDALIKAGHKVTVLDNLSSGKKENLNPRAKFVKADIRNFKKIQPMFKSQDGVFHLAALPRVQPSITDPVGTHDHNVNGTLNVLWAAKQAKIKRLVYSASSSAYGDTEVLPANEGLKPKPMSPYALQKYIGEEYCRLFSFLYGLETISLRYFNVYGPRMVDSGAYLTVIKILLNQKDAGQPLTITGDGNQTRDFTHVLDVVRANILAMESPNVGKGEVINIGAGKNWSVNQIAAIILNESIEKAVKKGCVKYLPARIEPRHSLAQNSLAKKLLGWEPKENLEKKIKEL